MHCTRRSTLFLHELLRWPERCVLFALLAIGVSATTVRVGAAGPIFSGRTDFATGSYPRCVAISDLNGDGIPDLVVANVTASPGTVSVLLGNGDGTFGTRADFVTGPGPQSVAIGDLNGDGKADLAVANSWANTVSVLLGNGNGTFGAKSDFATGDMPYSVAIGDLNRDGRPDLAVARWGSTMVSVLLGTGNGAFAARTDFGAGNCPSSVAIGDLNGDGNPDLAVTNWSSSNVSVFLGNGDGTFAAQTAYETGDYSHSVAIGDLNGDGEPDLAVANDGSGAVSVLLGNGSGTFGTKTDFGGLGYPYSVAIGDLNGDGKPDLVIANAGSDCASVLLGNGGGAFSGKSDYETAGYADFVALEDLNGDGKLDLVVANSGCDVVSVFLNIYSDLPTSTLVENFRAVSSAEGIRVEWVVGDPSAFEAIELQRSAYESGAWSPMQESPQLRERVNVVLDTDAAVGQEYWYRLRCVQRDGKVLLCGPISAMSSGAVTALVLSPPSPNPSAGCSLTAFAVPASTQVRLTLVDVQGREVAVLADGVRQSGRYTAGVEASDLRPGLYFVRLQAMGATLTRRLLIVK